MAFESRRRRRVVPPLAFAPLARHVTVVTQHVALVHLGIEDGPRKLEARVRCVVVHKARNTTAVLGKVRRHRLVRGLCTLVAMVEVEAAHGLARDDAKAIWVLAPADGELAVVDVVFLLLHTTVLVGSGPASSFLCAACTPLCRRRARPRSWLSRRRFL